MANKKIVKITRYFIIVFLIVYVSSSLSKGLINNQKMIKGYKHVVMELDREKLRNRELKDKITLTQDSAYMELLARKKLGLVKKDEIVYKIVYR